MSTNMEVPIVKILVIGDWQNAWVTAGCLTVLDHDVTLASATEALDVEEPHLKGYIEFAQSRGRFRRSDSPEKTWSGSYDYVWIAWDVEVYPDGRPVTATVYRSLAEAAKSCKNLIVSSQVPVGFCLESETSLARHGLAVRIAYVPENMRLGKGCETFLRADRVVVGATTGEYAKEVAELLKGVHRSGMPYFSKGPDDPPFGTLVLTDLPTAEMIKHATNAWLALNITFANELAELGKPFGVDMEKVTSGLRADRRIGAKAPLVAGDGFGGTLSRDVAALSVLPGATLMKTVKSINDARTRSRGLATWKKERS